MSIMPPDPDSKTDPPEPHQCTDVCPGWQPEPPTLSSEYNRGLHDAWVEAWQFFHDFPRWDADPIVLRFGWQEGRCGKCGEPIPDGA